METLKDLLDKWSQEEPEKCRRIERLDENEIDYVPTGIYDLAALGWQVFVGNVDAADRACLQAAVQEAIAARGLSVSYEEDDDSISLCLEDPDSSGQRGGSLWLDGRSSEIRTQVWIGAYLRYLESVTATT